MLLINPHNLEGRLEGFKVGVRSVFGGRWEGQARRLENVLERRLRNSLVRLAPAGLYPVIVGFGCKIRSERDEANVVACFHRRVFHESFSSIWR